MGGKERIRAASLEHSAPPPARSTPGSGRPVRVPRREAEHFRVLHHVPGRLRLIVPGLRRAGRAELEELARQLKSELIPGKVIGVTANPFTGSVTLTYDAAAIDILAWIEALLRRDDVSRLLGHGAS